MRRNKARRGQVSVQFHWIFIIIAGAIILAVFVGIVFKQKAVSEQKIGIAVVSELEPILAGAGVAEDTFNRVDVPDAEIQFICSGDYSAYTLPRTEMGDVSLSSDVIFSFGEISGKTLHIWTLGWQMPFKIMNFIMLTTPNTRYEFVYDANYDWLADQVYEDLPADINKGQLTPRSSLENIKSLGYENTRFIFIGDSAPKLPGDFIREPASALKITTDSVEFYVKFGRDFAAELDGEFPVGGYFTDKDAMLYGAIFSENKEMYLCNMKKAFERMVYVADILWLRAKEVRETYGAGEVCYGLYGVGIDYLAGLKNSAAVCQRNFDYSCFNDMYSKASDLLDFNNRLLRNNCILVY